MSVDVMIVGAGLAGLMAANGLQAKGLSVSVIDKGRSVGGRLATRRVGKGVADHGAQFFSVREAAFRGYVDRWIADGLVYEWARGWSDGSLKTTHEDGHPRYAVKGGMNQLAKHLAQNLASVTLNARVNEIQMHEDSWTLTDNHDAVYHGKALVLTPPVPQTLELLAMNNISLSSEDRDALERVQFGPCLCGLFTVNGEIDLPEPGALQDQSQPIYWLADNQRKGISPNARVITVHTSAGYSRQHWDESDEAILSHLREALETRLKNDSAVAGGELKRWRYSVPLTTCPQEYWLAKNVPTLILAGDAFGGRGRVEGAALSGLAAAKVIAEQLGK